MCIILVTDDSLGLVILTYRDENKKTNYLKQDSQKTITITRRYFLPFHPTKDFFLLVQNWLKRANVEKIVYCVDMKMMWTR